MRRCKRRARGAAPSRPAARRRYQPSRFGSLPIGRVISQQRVLLGAGRLLITRSIIRREPPRRRRAARRYSSPRIGLERAPAPRIEPDGPCRRPRALLSAEQPRRASTVHKLVGEAPARSATAQQLAGAVNLELRGIGDEVASMACTPSPRDKMKALRGTPEANPRVSTPPR